MSQTDPIGDLLAAVRNASRGGKPQVDVRASRLGAAVMEVLKQEGFIQNWRLMKDGHPQGTVRVYLKYNKDRRPAIRVVKRVSRPGLRIYIGKDEIPRVLSGIGMAVLTTPKGVLSGAQAKTEGVGGEVICYVW